MHLEASTKPHIHQKFVIFWTNIASTMAYLNFQNGPKNGLHPLGVKVAVPKLTFSFTQIKYKPLTSILKRHLLPSVDTTFYKKGPVSTFSRMLWLLPLYALCLKYAWKSQFDKIPSHCLYLHCCTQNHQKINKKSSKR